MSTPDDVQIVGDTLDATDPIEPDVPALSFCETAEDGTECDDGQPCTSDDTCQNGLCIGGTSKICDAEGPCRPGTCNEDGDCVYVDVEDGAACGVACFQEATCQGGECLAVPGSEQPCETPDNPCVDELKCDPSTGACTLEIVSLEGVVCDTDDDVCTLETCDGKGQCLDSGVLNTCELEASNNPCWTYLCSPKKGCLQSQFVEGVSCNDGNACTSNDSCLTDELGLKVCKGIPLAIDDGNPCTDDICEEGTISHVPLNGVICELDHPCSPNGICVEDTCKPQKECECYVDGDCGPAMNPCLGPVVCDTTGESPACVQDITKPIVCPPSNTLCQINQCQSDTGACALEAENDGTSCDDESACTLNEACFQGVCGGGALVDCDNGNVCDGLEVCDSKLGCVAGFALACDDLDPCNGVESCHPLLGCTEGNPPICTDGNVCNGEEVCAPNVGCVPGVELVCGDNVYCNGEEGCHPVTGCMQGTPPSVDDGIACTVDACDEANNASSHTPVNEACEDDNPCTLGLCDVEEGCQLINYPPNTPCPGGTCIMGNCTCIPSCSENSCGDDGCGGQCVCKNGLSCVDQACVVLGESPWDGSWTMTANPNTQSFGGLGVASFVPTDLAVQVNGLDASATASSGGQTVQYTGSATATTLSLSSQYVDASGISHSESYTLELIDPTNSKGEMLEKLSVLGLPFELQWNVTGVKK